MFQNSIDTHTAQPVAAPQAEQVAVSIIMPCLDEIISLPHCIANAREALARIEKLYGLSGEIVIADNGSTDGSQQLAQALGARVVDVETKGYGAALIGGCYGAWGDFLLLGDCDGSYNFCDGVAMIGKLQEGSELCMGSRFQGGIAPGAMPWKNRYIGNPVLTGILNLFFRSSIDDAHCGLRAIRKTSFEALQLTSTGMEFASEMVIKAHLRGLAITQVPATLSVDLRDRAPHLRPWRDGWRHLRYLLMLSPTWAFGVPAIAAMSVATLILTVSLLHLLGMLQGAETFGTSWNILAGFLFVGGHFAAITAVAAHIQGARAGYRPLRPFFQRNASLLTLETMLISGLVLMGLATAGFAAIAAYWSASNLAALPSSLPVVLAGVVGVVGMQNALAGFSCAIAAGHKAEFAKAPARAISPKADAVSSSLDLAA